MKFTQPPLLNSTPPESSEHSNQIQNQKLFRLELGIAKFLRTGVLVAGALLLAGWLAQIKISDFGHNPLLKFKNYDSKPFYLNVVEAWQQNNVGILLCDAGLVVLISLPLLRVAMTAVLFLKQGERVLAFVALFVLCALLLSFSLGVEL